jgi:hypothetical protein
MKKKKETGVAVKDNTEMKSILKEQTSVKVVLNGGKYRLDDATIPFQIGFDKEIADQEPTHILVVDVTKIHYYFNSSDFHDYDTESERSLFKIQPIHYLQLKSPGVHHLIFILLKDMDSNGRKFFLEKRPSAYRNILHFSSIEDKELDGELGYFEAIVSVPEEFFATAPKTKLQKAIWNWTNGWYRFKPIDQCEYRKRKITAFTIKPPLWFLGFLFRFICSVFLTSLSFISRVVAFILGYQPVSFFPNMKDMWLNFLFQDNKSYVEIFSLDYWIGYLLTKNSINWSDCIKSTDLYPFKTLVLFGKKIYTPLSLMGLITYPVLFFVYYVGIVYGFFGPDHYSGLQLIGGLVCLSLWITIDAGITIPTITNNKKWVEKWDEDTPEGKKKRKSLSWWAFSILAGIAVISFLIAVVNVNSAIDTVIAIAIGIGVIFILSLLIMAVIKVLTPFYWKLKDEIKVAIKEEKNKNQQWLETSFDINNMPPRIDFKALPQPSVSSHKLVLTFWRTKAKVCKPYAKS